jgi:hypothetical protein
MNWDAIGAIGEIIGAFAVVATLFYLAVQIRQNNRNVEESLRRLRLGEVDATVQSFARYRSLLAQADLAAVYVKGVENYDGLSEPEKVQFGVVMDEYMFSYWSVFQRTEEGAYEAANLDSHLNALRLVLNKPGTAMWWSIRKVSFPAQFVAFLEENLGGADP